MVNNVTCTYHERYTFTGKEKDEETGYGYFGARYMDHDLMILWLSVDPMADKYPSISPYAYCAWNPVKLVDPTGDSLDIPSKSSLNHSITKSDLLSIVNYKNKSRVLINENGSVTINTKGLKKRSLYYDVGLSLLVDMVNSEKKFFYETSDDYSSTMRDGIQHDMIEIKEGIINASNNGKDSKGGHYHLPQNGYDGHVILAKSGTWLRDGNHDLKTSLLFHELAENYYRTNDGLDYEDAHNAAINREKYNFRNTNPGRLDPRTDVYKYKGQKAYW